MLMPCPSYSIRIRYPDEMLFLHTDPSIHSHPLVLVLYTPGAGVVKNQNENRKIKENIKGTSCCKMRDKNWKEKKKSPETRINTSLLKQFDKKPIQKEKMPARPPLYIVSNPHSYTTYLPTLQGLPKKTTSYSARWEKIENKTQV